MVAIIAIVAETVWFRVPASLVAFGWSTYGKDLAKLDDSLTDLFYSIHWIFIRIESSSK